MKVVTGADNAATTTARDAYAVVETLAAALSWGAETTAPSAAAHLALRAALHPLLAPFREDPLLTLADRFISLDAQVAGLSAAASPFSTRSPDDRAALSALGLSVPPVLDFYNGDAVGTVAGALYLPAQNIAAPCRVWSVYGAGLPSDAPHPTTWPAPIAVRSVSPDVAASAQAALIAALHTLEAFGVTSRRALPPAPFFYDVCAPELPDDITASVAGPSLGLPLALAFLSALLQIPLPFSLAATGGVGRAGYDWACDAASVFPVDAVAEKAACLQRQATLFLVPVPAPDSAGKNALPEARGVASVAIAARIAAPALADLLAPGHENVAERNAPPVGERTAFVVAGIEGVGEFWRADENNAHVVLGAYDRLVPATLTQSGGYVLSQRRGVSGDGVCAAFADTTNACRAAVALLRVLRAHVWPLNARVPSVRVGVDVGTSPYLGGGGAGRGGAVLDRAVLLMEAARGGQILISGVVADEVSDAADGPEDADNGDVLHIQSHGLFRLPDLAEPFRIAQVWASGLADVRDPPRGLDARRHNLPVQAHPALWGRDTETAQIAEGLTRTRLLTLIGPGGVGKTRLALHTAARLLDHFSGGVWLVPVGELSGEAAIESALAGALGEIGTRGSVAERISGALARAAGPVLFILDECEAAADAVAAVTFRLLECPRVVVLVTSQTPLFLAAEQRFEVAPLSTPPSDASLNAIRDAAVIALFTERAQEASPDWEPSDADLSSIRRICELLDGLPLAVELAAARVRQMTPFEIEARLHDALDLLTSRLRDVPPRRRAVEAALSWSWGLLNTNEQRALSCLSVFGGAGFSRDAGCAVIAATVAIASLAASDLLDSLEEKSLLALSSKDINSRRRFALRNLVRAFAARRLRDAENFADAARRASAAHAAFFVDLAARLGPAENTNAEVDAFDALDEEMENLRAAFAFLQQNDTLRLPLFVVSITDFLRRRGHQEERTQWTNAALAVLNNTGVSAEDKETRQVQARLVYARGVADKDANRFDDAAANALDSLALGRSLGDGRIVGDALNLLGMTHSAAKRYEAARACHEEALATCRDAGWARGEAGSLHNLALALLRSGDHDQAQALYEQSVPLCRASGDRHGLAYALNNLAHIATENQDLDAAHALFAESLVFLRELKNAPALAVALANLGDVLDRQGESHNAAPLLVAGEEILTRLAHRHRAEVTKYVERCAARIGRERIAALRADAARRTLPALLATAPPPPPRHLDTV